MAFASSRWGGGSGDLESLIAPGQRKARDYRCSCLITNCDHERGRYAIGSAQPGSLTLEAMARATPKHAVIRRRQEEPITLGRGPSTTPPQTFQLDKRTRYGLALWHVVCAVPSLLSVHQAASTHSRRIPCARPARWSRMRPRIHVVLRFLRRPHERPGELRRVRERVRVRSGVRGPDLRGAILARHRDGALLSARRRCRLQRRVLH
jgi:hypothetical protein